MSVTIVTWIWPGERDYRPIHVAAMAAALERRMKAPYRFVVITDDVRGDYGSAEPLATPRAALQLAALKTPEGARFPSCYRRLWLFSDEAKLLGDRVLLTDVDAAVTGDWSTLWDNDAPFVGWHPMQRWGTHENRIAGGMWLLKTGALTHVYEDFVESPHRSIAAARNAGYRGSDQAWLSYLLAKRVPTWSDRAGVYSVRDFTERGRSEDVVHELPADCRVVHFNGHLKPWHAASWQQHTWLGYHWPVDVCPLEKGPAPPAKPERRGPSYRRGR